MQKNLTVTDTLPGFLEYLSVEGRYASTTIKRYREDIHWFIRDVGNMSLIEIRREHFITLKARMGARGAQESRMAGVINAVKSLLRYAGDVLEMPVVDLTKIKAPRPPRRDVVYLSDEELDRFLQAIPVRTWDGRRRVCGYRFRALCETLAATAMRLSEALSLNRDSINFDKHLAQIIGKGNKQRTVFFSSRALQWITKYLDLRTDKGEALFANLHGSRLRRHAVEVTFRRNAKWAAIEKRVSPHIIRHTAATILLRNGCPIGFIKEILGHERLETTCRYYLGILDKAQTQQAHRSYMYFGEDDKPEPHEPETPEEASRGGRTPFWGRLPPPPSPDS